MHLSKTQRTSWMRNECRCSQNAKRCLRHWTLRSIYRDQYLTTSSFTFSGHHEGVCTKMWSRLSHLGL